jgi:hypothetical protein
MCRSYNTSPPIVCMAVAGRFTIFFSFSCDLLVLHLLECFSVVILFDPMFSVSLVTTALRFLRLRIEKTACSYGGYLRIY